MTYPKLEDFLNALGYLYCTDSNVKDSCERMNVNFRTVPNCFGVELAIKAQAFNNFDMAKYELRDELSVLIRFVKDLRQIPTEDLLLKEKLDLLLGEDKIYNLCEKGINDPSLIIEDIKNLQDTLSEPIVIAEFGELLPSYLKVWKKRVEKNEQEVLIEGLEKLSEMIGGFNPGRLAILMGDTGFGKSNLGLTIALRARHAMPVVYFNMEMGFEDVSKRIAVLESKISHKEFYQRVKNDDWAKSFNDNGKGFYITEGKTLSPQQIKAAVRTIVKNKNIGLIVVDYDQCLELNVDRFTPEWKAIQNTLAEFDNFAKEINCFILVLAQLNRDGEISSSHRSLYKAHTVLHFKSDDRHGPIIQVKKNRHAKSNVALLVNYPPESSCITEVNIINYSDKKEKRQINVPATTNILTPRVPYADS